MSKNSQVTMSKEEYKLQWDAYQRLRPTMTKPKELSTKEWKNSQKEYDKPFDEHWETVCKVVALKLNHEKRGQQQQQKK